MAADWETGTEAGVEAVATEMAEAAERVMMADWETGADLAAEAEVARGVVAVDSKGQ